MRRQRGYLAYGPTRVNNCAQVTHWGKQLKAYEDIAYFPNAATQNIYTMQDPSDNTVFQLNSSDLIARGMYGSVFKIRQSRPQGETYVAKLMNDTEDPNKDLWESIIQTKLRCALDALSWEARATMASVPLIHRMFSVGTLTPAHLNVVIMEPLENTLHQATNSSSGGAHVLHAGFGAVARLLEYLQQQFRFEHRDLSGNNVMVRHDGDGSMRFFMTDFGMARATFPDIGYASGLWKFGDGQQFDAGADLARLCHSMHEHKWIASWIGDYVAELQSKFKDHELLRRMLQNMSDDDAQKLMYYVGRDRQLFCRFTPAPFLTDRTRLTSIAIDFTEYDLLGADSPWHHALQQWHNIIVRRSSSPEESAWNDVEEHDYGKAERVWTTLVQQKERNGDSVYVHPLSEFNPGSGRGTHVVWQHPQTGTAWLTWTRWVHKMSEAGNSHNYLVLRTQMAAATAAAVGRGALPVWERAPQTVPTSNQVTYLFAGEWKCEQAGGPVQMNPLSGFFAEVLQRGPVMDLNMCAIMVRGDDVDPHRRHLVLASESTNTYLEVQPQRRPWRPRAFDPFSTPTGPATLTGTAAAVTSQLPSAPSRPGPPSRRQLGKRQRGRGKLFVRQDRQERQKRRPSRGERLVAESQRQRNANANATPTPASDR